MSSRYAAIVFALAALQAQGSPGDEPFGPLSKKGGLHFVTQVEDTNSESLRSELAPLAKALGKADLVGLGEPIHGTHIFHPFRAALIKSLVADYGFRTLSFEAPWNIVIEANQYIQTCRGDLTHALAHPFWAVWKDDSIVELMQWLCRFNQGHPDHLVFLFGFDNQGGALDRDFILASLVEVRSPLASVAAIRLKTCLNSNDSTAAGKSAANACLSLLSEVAQELDSHVESYRKALGDERLFWTTVAIQSYRSFQIQISSFNLSDLRSMSTSMEARDAQMATNFQRIRNFFAKDEKSILYAANLHLAKNTETLTPDLTYHSMGTRIDRSFPERYAVVATSGYSIRINQKYFPNWTWVPSNHALSVEQKLHQAEIKFAYTSTQSAFLKNGGARYKLFEGPDSTLVLPATHYDWLFFANESGPQLTR